MRLSIMCRLFIMAALPLLFVNVAVYAQDSSLAEHSKVEDSTLQTDAPVTEDHVDIESGDASSDEEEGGDERDFVEEGSAVSVGLEKEEAEDEEVERLEEEEGSVVVGEDEEASEEAEDGVEEEEGSVVVVEEDDDASEDAEDGTEEEEGSVVVVEEDDDASEDAEDGVDEEEGSVLVVGEDEEASEEAEDGVEEEEGSVLVVGEDEASGEVDPPGFTEEEDLEEIAEDEGLAVEEDIEDVTYIDFGSGEDESSKDSMDQLLDEMAENEEEAESGEHDLTEADELADSHDAYETQRDFLTGELSSLGSFELIPTRNRIGVLGGYQRIGNDTFFLVNPVLDLRLGLDGEYRLGLGLPLNLYVYSAELAGHAGKNGFENLGSIRKEDYSDFYQYLRVLRYFSYGRKEADLYVNVGSKSPATIGHGTLVRRLNPNIYVDRTHLGAHFDSYWDWAGFQAYSSNIITWEMAGFLAFFRPLGVFSSEEIPKSLSFGFTYFQDRFAPSSLEFESGLLRIDHLYKPIPTQNETVSSSAINVEFKFLKTANVDVKGYLERASLSAEGLGAGYFVGFLGRLNFGNRVLNAFRIRTEYRSFDANFVPSYFDTFYEISQYQFNNPDETERPLTKLEVLRSRQGDARRQGVYLEATYSIPEAISLGVAYENASKDAGSSHNDSSFILHGEMPLFKRLQIMATYYRQNPDSFDTLFELSNQSLLFSRLRFSFFPGLYINLGYEQSFRLNDVFDLDGVLVSSHFETMPHISGHLEFAIQF